jgi:hypothetical protein
VLRVAAGAGERHPFGARLYRTTVQAAVGATEGGAAINPRGFPRYIYLAVVHGTFKVDISSPARVRSGAARWSPTFRVAMIQIDPKTGRVPGTSWSDKVPDLSSLGFWIDLRLPPYGFLGAPLSAERFLRRANTTPGVFSSRCGNPPRQSP